MQLRSFRERLCRRELDRREHRRNQRTISRVIRNFIFTTSDVRIMLIHCWNMSRNMVISVTS